MDTPLRWGDPGISSCSFRCTLNRGPPKGTWFSTSLWVASSLPQDAQISVISSVELTIAVGDPAEARLRFSMLEFATSSGWKARRPKDYGLACKSLFPAAGKKGR